MLFKDFIVAARNKTFWQQAQSFCFHGNSYQGLFFSSLFNRCATIIGGDVSFKKISLEDCEQKTFYAMFSQTMLGMQAWYWIGDGLAQIPEKRRKEFLDYFLRYQGPHTIAFFLEGNEKCVQKSSCSLITLDTTVDRVGMMALLELFGCHYDDRRIKIIKRVFDHMGALTLDSACLFMQYLDLVPVNSTEDVADYVLQVLGAPPTLVSLAESFFAKDAQHFFDLWSKLHHGYPDIFWIVFWADHVWRAYTVIQLLQAKDFVQAKRASFRLPYSFINRDWQKTSLAELTKVYENLYSLDFALKKGSNFTALDVLYSNYFNGKFAGV